MTLITGSRLGKWYGAERIFAGLQFVVNRGDKIALVGPNGVGKSTLIKLVAGVEHPTKGVVSTARGLRLAYLAQEATFVDGTLLHAARDAFRHITLLEAELRELEAQLADVDHPKWEARLGRYGVLQTRYEHAGGLQVEHTIEQTLTGLGFRRDQFEQPLATFSGGQKTRAALAVTLLDNPDVLLLDEPTNHLDLQALDWLEEFLRSWPGTLVIISHDRFFLDRVTTRTWELASERIDDYPGNYTKYLQLKAERLERQQKEHQLSQAHIAKEEEIIRRWKAGSHAREAKGREKLLLTYKYGRMGPNNTIVPARAVDGPRKQKKLNLQLDGGERSGDLALTLNRLEVGYRMPSEERVLVRTPRLELHRGVRVALLGANGVGKTTLLRTIIGEIPPLAGEVVIGASVSVGYYAQVHDELNPANTVLEEVHRSKPMEKIEQIRTLLGRFLFSRDDIYKRIRDLSGGERSRVALAQLTLRSPNLLLLDEPTNHLDIPAREALERVLQEFPGAILFVSHDRYFVDALADRLWIVADGTITEFEGNFSAYASPAIKPARKLPGAPTASLPRAANSRRN